MSKELSTEEERLYKIIKHQLRQARTSGDSITLLVKPIKNELIARDKAMLEAVIGEDTQEFEKKDYSGADKLWDLANGVEPISSREFTTWGSSEKAQYRKFALKLRNRSWFECEEAENNLRSEQRHRAANYLKEK